ncbi:MULTISPECIES: hypothetical protein [unclassified Mucilaginibacter]|uniref:hypothetical protein n=1 Tax=unclassified Mucilaginibacter TaxID=2617802 RepID=UPI0031F61093
MKNSLLVAVHVVCAFILLFAACSDSPKSNLKGKWHTSDGSTKLEITGKQFILTEDAPIAEDYFLKGDTIFTSFEGNQPYTRFVIQQLDDHNLKLLYPDSVSVAFMR